jgi:hypothetical protein
VLAHFAAVPGLFVTTERRCRIEHVVGVDPDDSGLHGFGKPVGARDVARPDAGRQSINRFVGLPNQIVIVVKADY